MRPNPGLPARAAMIAPVDFDSEAQGQLPTRLMAAFDVTLTTGALLPYYCE
jgi:hypothetical protein